MVLSCLELGKWGEVKLFGGNGIATAEDYGEKDLSSADL
jgi:hypothetical protein